jgi:oligopeptide transport system substrate-binding protein
MQSACNFERFMKFPSLHSFSRNNVVFLFALFVLYGCHNNDSENNSVFCYNESNGITSLDPAFSRDIEVMWATNQLFDGLVELDSNMAVVPCIARSWEISPNGLVYTFHLRDSVYFHASPLFEDTAGRKVVASDFVYSFQRLLDPQIASPAGWIFSSIDRTNRGGFEASNDSTLVIYLKQPFQPFLGMLSMQYCNVVPHEVVDHYKSDFRDHPIGSGPFKFAFWYENVALVFHKNKNYWQRDEDGHQLPYLSAVKIDFVKDMSVEFQGLIQGRYDFMSGIYNSFKDELLTTDGNLVEAYEKDIYFQKTPFIKTDYLGILMDPSMEINKNSPLMDVRIRQAISYSIDRKSMVKYLRNNTVFPAEHGFIPPTLNKFGSDSLYYPYNIAKAKALLNEAGFPDGKGLPEFTVSTTSDYTDLIEYIQHQLEQTGIKIKVNVLQGPALREQSAKGQLSIFRKSWLADYADAENFLAVFYSGNFCPNGPNYTHFSNLTYDALYEQSKSEKNDSIRYKNYALLNDLLMQEAPVIPLYYDQVSHFIRKEITGLQTNPINMLDLRTVKKLAK